MGAINGILMGVYAVVLGVGKMGFMFDYLHISLK